MVWYESLMIVSLSEGSIGLPPSAPFRPGEKGKAQTASYQGKVSMEKET